MAKDNKNTQQDKRLEKRAAALRENLKRRKTQQQAKGQAKEQERGQNDTTDAKQK